jgi:hypothetical protein
MTALIEGYLHELQSIVTSGKAASLTCTITGTYPNHQWNGDTVRVTPAKAKAALKRYQAAARKEMPAQAADIPESVNVCLKRTYRVSGKNPRTEPLFAYALNRVRRADKRAQRNAANETALAEAAENGGHWHAQGVDRAYPSETKARKAWAREHVGPDWWKGEKSSILAGATVRQGKPYAVKATKAKAAPAKVQSSTSVTVTVAQLRETCKTLKLPSTGNKATLVERITKHTLGL